MPELKSLPSKGKPQPSPTKRCPYCAELIQAEAIVCRFCGRQIVKFRDPKKPNKWYFSPEVKILTFLFLTPIWTLIVLDDPDSGVGVKIVAVILLIVFVLFGCGVCQGVLFGSPG